MDIQQKITAEAVRVAHAILTPLGYEYTLSTTPTEGEENFLYMVLPVRLKSSD